MNKPRMDDLQYVRDYYGVPAYRGMRVNVYGKDGVILKGQDAYIMVLVDGEKHAKPYHPTDGVTYKVEGIR